MNRCPVCGVNIDGSHKKCPLCQRTTEDGCSESCLKYPQYTYTQTRRKRRLGFKLTAFIAICIISICAVANFLSYTGEAWCLYIIPCVLYGWLLVCHTILSRVPVGSKITVQTLSISAVLLCINLLSGGPRWSLEYVFPFLVMASTLLITIIIMAKKMGRQEFLGYLMALILLGFLPLLLCLFGLSHVLWPSAAAGLYAFLTLIGLIIFLRSGLKDEINKRLHF